MSNQPQNVPACLMIIASSSACGGEQNLVREILANLGISCTICEWLSSDDFKAQVKDKKFDFIYLGAHADSTGFGEGSGRELHPWEALAIAICETDCIRVGGTLFMGCCRGGMRAVALKIMSVCGKIDQICGPFWTLKGNDITKAFHIFVEALTRQKEDPATAADRASEASRCKFHCYERLDLASDLAAQWRLEYVEDELQKVRAEHAALKKQVHEIQAIIGKFSVSDVKTAATKGNQCATFGGAFYS